MGLGGGTDSESRFLRYVECLSSVIGHADRVGPLRDYCLGLMVSCGRKSVEPMAAITAPDDTSAQHQSLLHFIGNARWSDEKVLAKVREMVLPEIERHGPVEAWIIDDTGFPKQGKHSVGASVQYCGQRGKQANCQAAVSLSLANHHASLPVAYQLYLPNSWAEDEKRRAKAGVPDEIEFKTKLEIAREQIEWACAANLPRGVVLMDAAYGTDASLRASVTDLGLQYAVAIRARALVAAGKSKKETSAEALALDLPKAAWKTITWRQGSAEPLRSRFARVRVRPCGDGCRADQPEEWLLIEWPKDEEKPTKFWLSTLERNIAFDRLVDITMMRWRIERDYLELKQEVGLGHFEGRGWVGFHHHATMCIAAYGFLISEKGAFPPSETQPARHVPAIAVPKGWRPRGSPAPA